jgi:hypothetical protein
MDKSRVTLFRHIRIIASVAALFLMLRADGFAGELAKAKLSDKPIEVLGGRLSIRMPETAKKEARPFDIMSAPESEEHETRVIYGAGQERLVLMAHESFAFAGDDFAKDVRDWITKWRGKYRIEPVQLQTSDLRILSVIPANNPDRTRSDDATFVEGLFVESSDRTIQSLDVYVNTAAAEDLEGCRAVARRILLSLAPGKKELKFAAGERRLFAYSKDMEISVTVPQGMVATQQFGPDFLVHRLIVLGRLGADSASIGIYVGNHPDFNQGAKKGEGMMFRKKVEWYSSRQQGDLQVLCRLPIPDEPSLFAHVWVHAPDDAQRKELRQVAESMKLVKVRDPASK